MTETKPRRDDEKTAAASLPIPNGWFAVEVSSDLGPGAVRTVRYFGRDLVVFRAEFSVRTRPRASRE